MPYTIFIEPSTQVDIEEAYDYYFTKGIHIAELFFEDLQYAYKILAINPFFQIRTKNYRAFPLKSFPYIFFFIIKEEKKQVKIVALFNTNQDTNKYPQ
jgi:plasmid stabilization system protein ParE